MKKKIILLSSIVLALCLLSTIVTIVLVNKNKTKLSNFQSLVQIIYDSESKLAKFNETNKIYDGNLEIYNKNTDFTIQRGTKVKSEVTVIEKKLSASGNQKYDETVTSYKTVGETKYTEVNGKVYQNPYTVPTYYLTFVLSEEFFDKYDLEKNENNYKLTGKILDNKISSFFLNKSLNTVTNLNIEIIVEDNLLKSFKANYISSTGFKVEISTTYSYGLVGSAKAVFYLEGGICQNTYGKVSYVYNFDGTKMDTLIIDPNVLEEDPKDQILKTGYHIEGWYQTKTENPDGTVTYSDKWDFAKDKMTIDGVTLYAKWEINRLYTYELYYYDQNNNEVFLDSYEVKEGEKFYDLFMDNKEVEGYTSLGYMDKDRNEWDENFTHPGGDSDLAIKVYLNLIEGDFTVVKTKRQFKTALTRNENIYLLNDIDFDGDEMCFDSYSGTILGNNHKVSNFEIDYDTSRNGLQGSLDDLKGSSDHLYISLFFELKDSVIKDITFDNILIDVNTNYSQIKYLIISPLAIITTNTKLENVKITGKITYTKTPNSENEIILNDFFYSKGEDVVVDSNSKATITE